MNDGDVILRGVPVSLDSAAGREFVVQCVRSAEGLTDDHAVQTEFEIPAETWATITQNKALIRAIQAERAMRVRSGAAARESAQRHFVRAPAAMAGIMDDQSANPRHRIESARLLKETALDDGKTESPASARERFLIVIDMGQGRVERYEKDLKPLPPAIENKPNSDWGWEER